MEESDGRVCLPLQGGKADMPLRKPTQPPTPLGAILTWTKNFAQNCTFDLYLFHVSCLFLFLMFFFFFSLFFFFFLFFSFFCSVIGLDHGTEATAQAACKRWIWNTRPYLGNHYLKLIENPAAVIATLTSTNVHNKPLWYTTLRSLSRQIMVLDTKGKKKTITTVAPSPTRCVLWLLSQFCILTPITDPAVVVNRYQLHENNGLPLMDLDTVIGLSLEKRGMMQCNCRNAQHYGCCPHSMGDLLAKGIVLGFHNQGVNDPTPMVKRGRRKNKMKTAKPGAHETIINHPTFLRR
jgi:hypothetical protein